MKLSRHTDGHTTHACARNTRQHSTLRLGPLRTAKPSPQVAQNCGKCSPTRTGKRTLVFSTGLNEEQSGAPFRLRGDDSDLLLLCPRSGNGCGITTSRDTGITNSLRQAGEFASMETAAAEARLRLRCHSQVTEGTSGGEVPAGELSRGAHVHDTHPCHSGPPWYPRAQVPKPSHGHSPSRRS